MRNVDILSLGDAGENIGLLIYKSVKKKLPFLISSKVKKLKVRFQRLTEK